MAGLKAAAATASAAAATALLMGAQATSSASPIGSEQQVVGPDGSVAAYSVTDLQPTDSTTLNVPGTGGVPLAGRLWSATTTVSAVRGQVIPAMRAFNARTADGQNYRVLDQALAPDLDVSPMSQGQRTTGHIYFDVTGPAPTVVAYNDGAQDRMVWSGQ
ncbi:DUF1942 domain-containing protein [Mycolicibacterium brisbanense]|uniref:MPT63-like domain-containing protein n=1 Tax=Mycolicibacterium brisbanense TaxID=146020 RepID=A0A100VYB5_9MYCO|nr:DUF1942 domain-containing protein [Mycolicibacterium brisbanense]MCV7160981.1 DUF1942 domain-containing protein [Mycolicibacterium brisbanense]GAS88161.1 uncharacterized protein RMCB_2257 [Mycolicibacterium brisbanense]